MKRDDPSVLKLFNLTEEEAGDPGKALLSAGVRKMFDVCAFMKLPVDLGADGMGKSDGIADGLPSPRIRSAHVGPLPGGEGTPPLWQSMTGLFPGSEQTMSPEAREEALENLVEIVLRLLRFEMKAESEKPNLYHTVYWDPLQKICTRLGIARAELSRLAKEATGLAAHELVDVVRVKTVKEKMKEHVRIFLKSLKIENCELKIENLKGAPIDGEGAGCGGEDAGDSDLTEIKKVKGKGEKDGKGDEDTGLKAPPTEALTALGVWKLLKEARRGPQFHLGQWALFLGFPNYARFYRACLVFHQLAPQQLELIAIEEVLEEIKKEKGKIKKDENDTGIEENEDGENEKERMAKVVWEELKKRHVQFFAGVAGRVWAEAG